MIFKHLLLILLTQITTQTEFLNITEEYCEHIIPFEIETHDDSLYSIRYNKDITDSGNLSEKTFYLDLSKTVKRTSNCYETKIGNNSKRVLTTTVEL